jgi:hypothetical protein
MERLYYARYMKELVATTQAAGPLWRKLSGQDFIGQRQLRMLEIWYGSATLVSVLHQNCTLLQQT